MYRGWEASALVNFKHFNLPGSRTGSLFDPNWLSKRVICNRKNIKFYEIFIYILFLM